MFYFLDSSALVKRYISEIGSNWIQTITDPSSGNWLYISRITTVEIVAALTRRVRTGTLTLHQATLAINEFKREIAHDYRILELSPIIANRAIALAETYSLRGYDAVQLASSLTIKDKLVSYKTTVASLYVLVSADNDLNNAASLESLAVENPNHHP